MCDRTDEVCVRRRNRRRKEEGWYGTRGKEECEDLVRLVLDAGAISKQGRQAVDCLDGLRIKEGVDGIEDNWVSHHSNVF